MAKSKHHNFIDTVDIVLTDAVNQGMFQLTLDDTYLDGREISIHGNKVVNFGSCSYLGLETDARVKKGAIEATLKYGTQFSSSRAYMSSPQYAELEYLLDELFDCPSLATLTTSLAHISAIPILVNDEDAVIIDHQVHATIQNAVQLLKPRGIHVEMIRHNKLEVIEDFIKKNRDKYRHVWYMIDGVYSMYGDLAPIAELNELMKRYPQLHVYADDAHGMSWAGKHGRGYLLSQTNLSPQWVSSTSLAKAFGCGGGVLMLPTPELKRKIKTCGAAPVFSGPLQPPMIGAAVASAKIHLSDEIYILQDQLNKRINLTNELLKKHELPVVDYSHSPVFFVGVGLPKVGYNIVNRMLKEGFYVNVGIFPGVPVKCTGIRFTNTIHQTFTDIENMISALAHHLPLALEEEGSCIEDVYKAFKMKGAQKSSNEPNIEQKNFNIEHKTSITEIDKTEWDSMFEHRGTFDWQGLLSIERIFKNQTAEENNWNFHYLIVRDKLNNPIAATFFTVGLYKDDMLAPESVSFQIEEKRKSDPYYLVTKTMAMGCLVSEGDHLFLNKDYPEWKNALKALLKKVSDLQEKEQAQNLILRDFEAADAELCNTLLESGFVQIHMPGANVLTELNWNTTEEFLNTLSPRNRRHIRTDVLKNEHFFEIEICKNPSDEQQKLFFELYKNVSNKNLGLNVFQYPDSIITEFAQNPNWEFIVLKLKENNTVAGVVWCYNTGETYSPMIVGLDYEYNHKYGTYRQAIYQVLKQAKLKNAKKIHLGFTADIEKRKFGATVLPKVAFIQAKDNYNMEVISNMSIQAV